jgi:hypothetical protein
MDRVKRQRPMKESTVIAHGLADVYLDEEVTIA